jgi:high-affinity Fe2+/Pb2+ permease
MADGIVPAIIWVLFGGAFLTIGFTFFFGAENLRAQSLMTGALSVLIFAGLLTVVENRSSVRRFQHDEMRSITALHTAPLRRPGD